MSKGNDIVPIPGAKRRLHLQENAAAAARELAPADLAELEDAIPPGSAAGARYHERGMAAVNR
jgi:aryl-alcohol dehydrogenase-like predicted oxidoreductase